MILEGARISLAADCWTSPTNKPFLIVTCYFFILDFSYKEALLGLKLLYRFYNVKYLTDIVLYILE